MSLFENDRYQWRETYFVLFDEDNRPPADAVRQAVTRLGSRYEISQLTSDEQGKLEALTLLAPDDHAALDICYLNGEDVEEQLATLKEELKKRKLTGEEEEKRRLLTACNARFDIFHFEQIDFLPDEEEEFLDPGALLLVMDQLTQLCGGVGIDPQTGELM